MTKMTAEQVLRDLRDCEESYRQARLKTLAKCYELAADHVERNLVETDEQRRERFEAWCTFRGFSTERHRAGPYLANVTQAAWYAWQAALTWRGETKGGEQDG